MRLRQSPMNDMIRSTRQVVAADVKQSATHGYASKTSARGPAADFIDVRQNFFVMGQDSLDDAETWNLA